MRHKISGRKLGRTTSERNMLFRNLANSLIINEQIKSTLPKAKELRSYVDKLITLAKKGTLAHRRRAFALLRDTEVVSKLFSSLNDRYKDRNGGYTRVLHFGFRKGDNSPMAIIELVDRDVSVKGAKDKERLLQEAKAQGE